MTIDIAAIRARAEEIGKRADVASKGDWWGKEERGTSTSSELQDRNPECFILCADKPPFAFGVTVAAFHFRSDRDFVARARTDIPALLTDISDLVEEVERLTKQNSAITNAADHLLMVRNTRAEAAEQRAAAAEKLLKTLVKYAEWQMNEGPGHHPTLPSAVSAARAHLSAHEVKP